MVVASGEKSGWEIVLYFRKSSGSIALFDMASEIQALNFMGYDGLTAPKGVSSPLELINRYPRGFIVSKFSGYPSSGSNLSVVFQTVFQWTGQSQSGFKGSY